MNLEDLKQPDGWYKFDGCDYEEAADVLQSGVLGFCGCGCPEKNLEYIRQALEIIDDPRPKWSDEHKSWEAWWPIHKEKVRAHFGNDQSAYFFYYWAAKNDLTEHGGSVPGWLSDKGRTLLKLLNQQRDAESES